MVKINVGWIYSAGAKYFTYKDKYFTMINIPVKPRRNLFCQEYEAFSFQLKSLAWYISIIDKPSWEPINIII